MGTENYSDIRYEILLSVLILTHLLPTCLNVNRMASCFRSSKTSIISRIA